MADVFVSYATEDRERVKQIVKAIEAAGFSVWWDRRIEFGSSFDREIERELAAAACVVVFWSQRSIESDWVRNEAQEGLDRGVLVPILIDDVRPPLAFRRAQTAQLVKQVSADELSRLVVSISSIVTGKQVSVPPMASVRLRRVRYAPRLLTGLCIVIASVSLMWLLDGKWPSDSALTKSNESLLRDISVGIEQPVDLTGSANFAAWPRTIAQDLVDAVMDGTPLLVVPEYGKSSSVTSRELDYRLRSSLRADPEAVLHLELVNNRSGKAIWIDEIALSATEPAAPGFPRAPYVAHVLNLTIGIELRQQDMLFNNEDARALFVRAFVGEQLGYSEGRARGMSHRDAVRLVERAAELEPDSPGPTAYLAYLYTFADWLEDDYARSAKANEAGNKALSIAPDNPWAHYQMGIVKRGLDRDFDAAEHHFQLARRFGSSSESVEFHLGEVDKQRGDLESAVSHYEESIALGGSAMAPYALASLCDVLMMLGRYDEAEKYLNRWESSVHAEQAKVYAPWARMRILAERGELDAARTQLDNTLKMISNPPTPLVASSMVLVGREDEARELLNQLEQRYVAGERFNCFFAFLAAYRLGDLDRAFTWLDRAVALRQSHPMLYGIEFEPIREDPRFRQALEGIDAYTIRSTPTAQSVSELKEAANRLAVAFSQATG